MFGTLYSGTPADVLDHYQPRMTPGTIVWTMDSDGPRAYRYVNLGADSTVQQLTGAPMYFSDAAATTVIADCSDSTCPTAGGSFAGVWIRPVATSTIQDGNYYAFVQCAGKAACLGDGSIAKGEIIAANDDNAFDTWGSGEAIVGCALEDDTATTGAGGTLEGATLGGVGAVAFWARLFFLG